MIILDYPSKKVLREQVGRSLRYIETSMFGPEYRDNGTLTGANRPSVTGHRREFFAKYHDEGRTDRQGPLDSLRDRDDAQQ